MIEFIFYSECFIWVLHQLVSPSGGGVLASRPGGANGSWHFFILYFSTLMLLHPPLEARKSLCVTSEACIHASEGAQVPHNHVGMIEVFFYSEYIFWVLHQPNEPWWGGSQHRDPSRGQLGPVVAGILFYHILSPCCTCTPPGSWGELVCCI
jgi:hypothetical protein